ncbi:hypothetical protein K8B33_12605 [Alcanivorax sp. JB21]|uniref:hypothetical protein n=1 Tax=Alcanivorax limicola TaxID=2874102 RepID=UPI001CC03669|nr:hypothetical protein [Alcanivorax limicola]MBZ2189943.1 hypothetical protein [Alcanivorax limicola]
MTRPAYRCLPVALLSVALLVASLGLSGCAREYLSDQERMNEQIPWEMPPVDVDLDAWQAPATLGAFTFQGEMQMDERALRLLRYVRAQEDGREQRLDIHLFPIPSGWEDMAPTRRVAGQYGQQRQSLGERAVQRGAREVTISEERMDVAARISHPLAVGHLLQHYASADALTVLTVTALPPIFLSATATVTVTDLSDSERDQRGTALDADMRTALLEFAAANTDVIAEE